MKNIRLFLTVVLCSSAISVQAQISPLHIDWSHFKGAKTIIEFSFPGNPGNAHTKVSVNERGQVLTEEFFNNAQLRSKKTYKYDMKDRVIERNWTRMIDTKSPRTYLYIYSYRDDKCDELLIADNGTVLRKIESSFNALGQKISEAEFGDDGTVTGNCYEFVYDNLGNQTGFMHMSQANAPCRSNGPGSRCLSKGIIRYDEYNNPVFGELYDALGNITSTTHFKYAYDEHHNWTKRIVNVIDASGKITSESTTELTITYY